MTIVNRRILAAAFAASTLGIPSAFASGPSLNGMNGVIRVHAADVNTPGYFAGSMYGLYAREPFTAANSPRARGETVKFGGSSLALVYAPTKFVELALGGNVESQFVTPGVGEKESQIGLGMVSAGVKALLTPANRTQWRLAAEFGAGASTGDGNALIGSWDPEGFDLEGRLALTFTQPRADHAQPVRAHANAGFLSRTGAFDEAAWAVTSAGAAPGRIVLHGDQFLYGAAVEVPAPRRFTVFTEWSGEYDLNADAPFADNPMRVTPGVRWATNGGGLVATAGWEISVASEESGPGGQLVAGLTLGGYATAVSGQVAGIVRDAESGAPIVGAKILARGENGEPVVTGADGRFLTDLDEGYVVLDLAAEGFTPKTRVVEVKGHEAIDLDFTLSRRNLLGTVQGHVQDGVNGAPVAARARIQGTEAWAECDPETGSFVLPDVPEGFATVEFDARSYIPWTSTVRVVAGEVAALDATLDRDENYLVGQLVGTVRDAVSGNPVDATILIGGAVTRTIPVDPATGTFEADLDAGSYTITIARAGYLSKTETVQILERQSQAREVALTPLPSNLALDGALFDSGSATIKRESFASLDEAGKFLLENPDVRVVIRGHTDPNAPTEGVEDLAQRRADAVMKYLVVSYGIDPVRLRAVASEEKASQAGAVELKLETQPEAD